MMKTVNFLQRGYKRPVQFEGMRVGGIMGLIDERYNQAEPSGLYLVRDGVTITMDDLSCAVSGSEETLSGTSPTDHLVELSR